MIGDWVMLVAWLGHVNRDLLIYGIGELLRSIIHGYYEGHAYYPVALVSNIAIAPCNPNSNFLILFK